MLRQVGVGAARGLEVAARQTAGLRAVSQVPVMAYDTSDSSFNGSNSRFSNNKGGRGRTGGGGSRGPSRGPRAPREHHQRVTGDRPIVPGYRGPPRVLEPHEGGRERRRPHPREREAQEARGNDRKDEKPRGGWFGPATGGRQDSSGGDGSGGYGGGRGPRGGQQGGGGGRFQRSEDHRGNNNNGYRGNNNNNNNNGGGYRGNGNGEGGYRGNGNGEGGYRGNGNGEGGYRGNNNSNNNNNNRGGGGYNRGGVERGGAGGRGGQGHRQHRHAPAAGDYGDSPLPSGGKETRSGKWDKKPQPQHGGSGYGSEGRGRAGGAFEGSGLTLKKKKKGPGMVRFVMKDKHQRGQSRAATGEAWNKRNQQGGQRKKKGRKAPVIMEKPVVIRDGPLPLPTELSVGDLATRLGIRIVDVVKTMLRSEMTVTTVEETVDFDTASLICLDYDVETTEEDAHDALIYDVHTRPPPEDFCVPMGTTPEEAEILTPDVSFQGLAGDESFFTCREMAPRPPIVTVMGHVDHGKTTLLDTLRGANVAADEAGGITQSIGAFKVQLRSGSGEEVENMTFLDTPGHAAFQGMRARGAALTDVVVLVVAAEDGVKPQTIEAIELATASNVPMVVAITKCSLPGADPEAVRKELVGFGVTPEEFGGDTVVVEISAKEGKGMEELKEAISMQAEMLELRAEPEGPAEAVIVESESGRGVGAKVSGIVTRGKLKIGDSVVIDTVMGKIKSLINQDNVAVESASPGDAVEIVGLHEIPSPGSPMIVVADEQRARDVSLWRKRRAGNAGDSTPHHRNIPVIDGRVELPVILRGSTMGSLDVVGEALASLPAQDEVLVRVIKSGVGALTDGDLVLAKTTGASIFSFNQMSPTNLQQRAEKEGIPLKHHRIIYRLLEDVSAELSGHLAPIEKVDVLGRADVLQTFSLSNGSTVAGCKVVEGELKRGETVDVVRDDVVIHRGPVDSIRHFKDEVTVIKKGNECGVGVHRFSKFEPADVLKMFKVRKIPRKLGDPLPPSPLPPVVPLGSKDDVEAAEEAAAAAAVEL